MLRRRAYKLSLAAFVVLTIVWVASYWGSVWYTGRTTLVIISEGTVVGLDAASRPAGLGYGLSFRSDAILLPGRGTGVWLNIPLWIPALLTGIATLILGRCSRRILPGHRRPRTLHVVSVRPHGQPQTRLPCVRDDDQNARK